MAVTKPGSVTRNRASLAKPSRFSFRERASPFRGPRTKNAVERTSAASPVRATTVAEPKSGAGPARPRIEQVADALAADDSPALRISRRRDGFILGSRSIPSERRRSARIRDLDGAGPEDHHLAAEVEGGAPHAGRSERAAARSSA